jgi:hypothetical protein
VHDVIEIGRRLTDAKARCGHGNWLPWLEREFGWSDSTALRYMQAHQFATDKSVTVTDLSLKSLYLLAAPSTPEAARDEVIERSEAGEHLTPAQIKETIDKAVNAEIEAKLQTVRAEADEREAAIRAEYKGRVHLTPEQLQAQLDKAMIPLHKQIQKYEVKLAKIEEREEKRAKAAKKNAGKADRKKPPIDRELSLAEAGVRSSLRDIFLQIECLTPKQMIDVAADRARITEQVLQTLWVTLRIKRRWCQNGWRSMLLQPSRPCRWSLPTILTRPILCRSISAAPPPNLDQLGFTRPRSAATRA